MADNNHAHEAVHESFKQKAQPNTIILLHALHLYDLLLTQTKNVDPLGYEHLFTPHDSYFDLEQDLVMSRG